MRPGRGRKPAASASGAAVMGYSTGGYCATNLTFQHPAWFGAAVSIAGYDRPALGGTTGNLFGADPQAPLANDVVWRAEHLPMPRANVPLVGARRDPPPVLRNLALERAVRAPTQVYDLTLPRALWPPLQPWTASRRSWSSRTTCRCRRRCRTRRAPASCCRRHRPDTA